MDAVPAQDVERTSRFAGSKREWLELVRTIVAMANTAGGTIQLEALDCPPEALDPELIDDHLNRYIEPKFRDISSVVQGDGRCEITVKRSSHRPHIFIDDGTDTDDRGEAIPVFHRGQVFARHESRTEPADGDDLERMMAETIGRLLEGLGVAIERLAVQVREPGTLPVTLAAEGAIGFSIRKPEEMYPYLTSELAEKLGKSINWVAKALQRLGLRGDPRFRWEVPTGRVARSPRYTEEAYQLLRDRLEKDPDWDPYHD